MAITPGPCEDMVAAEVYTAYDNDLCGGIRKTCTHYMDRRIVWNDDNGRIHRDGGLPAIVFYDGTQNWVLNGAMHRDGGLPAIIYPNGECQWWVNGTKIGTSDDPPEGAVFPGQLTKPARAQ